MKFNTTANIEDIMEDRWLSMDEMCEYLGVSDDTIHRWIKTKKMPATKIGRCWKFKKNLVDDWADNAKSGQDQKKIEL